MYTMFLLQAIVYIISNRAWFQGTIWILAIASSCPQLYEYSVYEEIEEEDGVNITEQACGSHGIVEHFETLYSIVVVIVMYVIPGLLLVINYSMLAR